MHRAANSSLVHVNWANYLKFVLRFFVLWKQYLTQRIWCFDYFFICLLTWMINLRKPFSYWIATYCIFKRVLWNLFSCPLLWSHVVDSPFPCWTLSYECPIPQAAVVMLILIKTMFDYWHGAHFRICRSFN